MSNHRLDLESLAVGAVDMEGQSNFVNEELIKTSLSFLDYEILLNSTNFM